MMNNYPHSTCSWDSRTTRKN